MFNGGRKRKASRKRSQGRSTKRLRAGVVGNKSWFHSGGSTRGNIGGRPSQVFVPGTIGVAGRAFVKLRTMYWGSYTSTSGAFTTARIAKINSIFDPTGTLGSIKPSGYTQWAAMYHSYIVHACKVELQLHRGTGDVVASTVVMAPSSGTQTAPTTIYDAAGQPFARHITIPEGSSTEMSKMFVYTSIGQVIGQDKKTIAYDDTFAALVTADPATLCHMNVSMQSIDAATTSVVEFAVFITQWVEFFGPKLLTQT